jgi:hypothetical protein
LPLPSLLVRTIHLHRFANLHSDFAGVASIVKTVILFSATALVTVCILAGTALGDPPVKKTAHRTQKVEERTVFVTGSLIPQRIKLQPIGTTTVSPVRIIDRHEIDSTGRQTTAGALINEPSLRVIGH